MRRAALELTLVAAVFLAIYVGGTAYRMDVTSAILGSLAVICGLVARQSYRALQVRPFMVDLDSTGGVYLAGYGAGTKRRRRITFRLPR